MIRTLQFLNFLSEDAPRHPLKTWTVDTVGYSIQIRWLLQFLLKPLGTLYSLHIYIYFFVSCKSMWGTEFEIKLLCLLLLQAFIIIRQRQTLLYG